jgi:hypothetical protein
MGLNYNPSIVSEGLVYYLDAANRRCYSGSGLTANGLVGSINGSLINGVGFTSTNNGYFSLDGTNDYIAYSSRTTNLEFQYNSRFTISIFCYITENTDAGHILNNRFSDAAGTNYCGWVIMQNSGYIWALIGGYPNGTAGWRQVSTSTSSFNSLVYNKWCQITLLNTGVTGEQKIYLNGIDHTSSASDFSNPPYTIDYSNGNSRLFIGYGGLNEHPTSSQISQVQIYNRALTPQEISQNFNATRYRYGI